MSINFPTSIDALTNPTAGNPTTSPEHATQHADANDAIEALEAKVGVNSSAVTTSHDYKLGEVTGTDKAVGKTSTQTLTNKTLTSPQINFGSDARGDIMVRNSSGVSSRFAVGTSGQILSSNASGDPEWVANPAVTDASTTVKGVSEIATTAEITAGTGTGATGAVLVVPASAVGSVGASKIVQFNSSTQYPAADGSLITSIAGANVSGVVRPIAIQTADVSLSASGTETDVIANTSVAGGTLATGRALKIQGYFESTTANSSGSTAINLYYGGSVVANLSHTGGTGTLHKGKFEFVMAYTGASTQYISSFLHTLVTTTSGTAGVCSLAASNTAAVASGSAQNIKVTVDPSDANTPTTVKVYGTTITFI